MMDNGSWRKKGKEGHPTILKMESFLIFSGSTFLLYSVAFDQPNLMKGILHENGLKNNGELQKRVNLSGQQVRPT